MDQLKGIFSKDGILILIQVDHVSGELLGTLLDDFYKAGAHNVQLIATVTKKNRPGHLLLIDTCSDSLEEIEYLILHELGATGWHVFETSHRHVATDIISATVCFDSAVGTFEFEALVKTQKDHPERLRPEHDSCVYIRNQLKERGVHLSLQAVSQSIIEQVSSQK